MEAESQIEVSYADAEVYRIEAKRDEYAALTCDGPKGYDIVVKAIADCRNTRGDIEKRRVFLKADSLAYGRKVDRVAKELTALVESIEDPLRAKKGAADEVKALIKAEKEAAERAIVEAQQRAEREAEEARLADERLRLEAEQAELRRQREKYEAEANAFREEQAAVARAEANRLAVERADLLMRLQLAEDARRAEEHARRAAELAPDPDKVRAFAKAIREIPGPVCTTYASQQQVEAALGRLSRAADGLEAFTELT